MSRVGEAVGEDGVPQDPALEKRADGFLDELVWFAEAIAERKARG